LSESIIISACLLGEPCRFDGQGKHNSSLLEVLKNKHLISVCPEVEGGLTIPRPPAEINGNRVLRESGEDVTRQFEVGAELCVTAGIGARATLAILKSRSPACGCGQVYDGSFSKTLISGDGIFTQLLKKSGIECISDEQFLANSKSQ